MSFDNRKGYTCDVCGTMCNRVTFAIMLSDLSVRYLCRNHRPPNESEIPKSLLPIDWDRWWSFTKGCWDKYHPQRQLLE